MLQKAGGPDRPPAPCPSLGAATFHQSSFCLFFETAQARFERERADDRWKFGKRVRDA
jgi:hypothetical protein